MAKQSRTELTKERLEEFKKSLRIVKTGKDESGNRYNAIGQLNQAAWIGEHSEILIEEIERLWAKIQK